MADVEKLLPTIPTGSRFVLYSSHSVVQAVGLIYTRTRWLRHVSEEVIHAFLRARVGLNCTLPSCDPFRVCGRAAAMLC
eukprot:4081472-Amphidinium_carterae.1